MADCGSSLFGTFHIYFYILCFSYSLWDLFFSFWKLLQYFGKESCGAPCPGCNKSDGQVLHRNLRTSWQNVPLVMWSSAYQHSVLRI